MIAGLEKSWEGEIMRRHICVWIRGLPLAVIMVALPTLVLAQTPEPAAGNPAVNNTPSPSGGNGAGNMASPSNAGNIPKGSNPEGGSGNLSAGSGATPPSAATEQATPSQTANNPESSINDNAPGDHSSRGNGLSARPPRDNSASNGAASPDSMPQGRYASPPTSLER
jgi:hypothetical protein